ncbi:hypothetical protein EW146_g78 [Bondarzewia mesenterica]|uniref:Saccharopine dehydrogenase [NAD(+), L-lysine-forming] n=1 Tax=Bondarzewia mesenterica TaxID=1095465 RepID=A0A4S4M809_9AGAM|nr:hypothetical protein EW146_g78 [Bondarzewia mesenterica]
MPGIHDCKCILVIGATSGIAGRRQDRLDELAKMGLKTVQLDVAADRETLINSILVKVLKKYSDLDAVVFSAGIQLRFDFRKPEEIDINVLNLALVNELNTNYLAIVTMIVNSALAIIPGPSVPNYSAAKAALRSLCLSLDAQLQDKSVHVIEIIPPLVESELHDKQGTTERLSKIWMPLNEFVDGVMEGLGRGDMQIAVGMAASSHERFESGKMDLTFWLRCEKKEFERRAALTPTTSKKLIDSGFKIFVERDEQRIFDDSEYESVGCELVEHNSWPHAPVNVPIIGLKELPVSDAPLPHTHVQFAHCYKQQAGWSDVLARFYRGKGTLYDLEFLNDEHGRRVAAFGFHAGFAGAAAGALALASQRNGGKKLGHLEPYANEEAMVKDVKEKLGGSGKGVKALVIGALGRCGRGAVDLFRKIGLDEDDIVKWDMAETAKGGPFQEILDVDVFVNCIYLTSRIPSFLTEEQIAAAGKSRRLRVVVDVSCDTTNPNNPIPIYSVNTTFSDPTLPVNVGPGNPPLSVISIDHLPTLLPREASEQFSSDLLPSLLVFPERQSARVWTDAEKVFQEKLAAAVKAENL